MAALLGVLDRDPSQCGWPPKVASSSPRVPGRVSVVIASVRMYGCECVGLYVCVSAYVCADVCECVCTCESMWGWEGLGLLVFSCFSFPVFHYCFVFISICEALCATCV